ncbi:MAG: mechanosensitive ion channel, partial [Saprospiraceae bacterium]
IAAILLLGIFYIVGKYVVSILSDLLKNVGIDQMSTNLGFNAVIGDRSLSGLIGNVALFFIMFTGIIAAADKLELGQVQSILNDIFHISGKVFFGLIILMAGVLISNFAGKTLSQSENSNIVAPLARFAILGIFLAFALHTMGIAESIVNLAFGLTLGAIAVAFALSFGLGGKKAAGQQMEHFFENMRNTKTNKPKK